METPPVEPNAFLALVQSVGVPVALLAVLGYIFIQMTTKNSQELSETHKWIRETMLSVQKETTGVVSRCEATMSNLLETLAKRTPDYHNPERKD